MKTYTETQFGMTVTIIEETISTSCEILDVDPQIVAKMKATLAGE